VNVTVKRAYIRPEMSDHRLVLPTSDDVRAELDRILASDVFANTGRLARLLRYVVERSLAGEGDQLKEYVLGLEVFDRGEQYDPRLDSIVRVEARRLRSKLDDYYRDGGRSDRVVITIPRGTYAPIFALRTGDDEPSAASTADSPPARGRRRAAFTGFLVATAVATAVLVFSLVASRPSPAAAPHLSIAVLPFEQYTGAPDDARLASRLTDAVTSEMARLGTVSVVSRTSARQFEGTRTPLRQVAAALNADFVVEGTLEPRGRQLHVSVRLVNAATDRKVWAEDFDAADAALLPPRIARAAAQAALERSPLLTR
jgi:TolB-like protein